ncbi:hypothetical protein M3147_08410 [Agromyces mediolanus]|uniref:hypothetical protein n=1 Tax=Agromyces mediolanus TaxID=41986 RepID=UPI0020407118|nr:hypothetical protein [Agromyces mediolanus]MCM3657271.1 hypothetical protein [Agromyces mediolanus]
MTLRVSVLLSMRRALRGLVTPGLRAVAVRWDGGVIAARFLFDHDPGKEDRADVSLAERRVVADFTSEYAVQIAAIWIPRPMALILNEGEEWVYLRKEWSFDELIVEEIVSDFREELKDDYVELWALPWRIRRAFPGVSDERVRELGAVILKALLTDAVMGNLDGNTGRFHPWSVDGFEVAMSAWRALDRDPNMGDIGWIAALPLDD